MSEAGAANTPVDVNGTHPIVIATANNKDTIRFIIFLFIVFSPSFLDMKKALSEDKAFK